MVLQLKINASKRRVHLMSLSFQLVGISCSSVAAICRWNRSMMMCLSATCQEVNISHLIFVGLQRPRVCALAHKHGT